MENSSQVHVSTEFSQPISESLFYERRYYYALKRLIDIFLSIVALVLLSPVLLVSAVLIKLDSAGPVIYKQKRVGARLTDHGEGLRWERKDFFCFKLRSMTDNAREDIHKEYIKAYIANDQATMQNMEGKDASMHKLVHDMRVTRIGKILRKFSLDEIPQFWNVLRGEMSLVGPRPNIPYELEMYSARHFQRLQATPGITGLQQITARCTASFDEQVNLDIQYIKNQSTWLDLKIILLTPITIFTQKGA